MHKLAVFRPNQGALIVRSADYPHLSCSLNWNTTEKTWDCPCPCHGSRFASDAAVINGHSPMPLLDAPLEI